MIKTSLRARVLTVSAQANNKKEFGMIVVSEQGHCWELATKAPLEKGHELKLKYQLQANLKTVKPGTAFFSGIGAYRVLEQKQNASPEVLKELFLI